MLVEKRHLNVTVGRFGQSLLEWFLKVSPLYKCLLWALWQMIDEINPADLAKAPSCGCSKGQKKEKYDKWRHFKKKISMYYWCITLWCVNQMTASKLKALNIHQSMFQSPWMSVINEMFKNQLAQYLISIYTAIKRRGLAAFTPTSFSPILLHFCSHTTTVSDVPKKSPGIILTANF